MRVVLTTTIAALTLATAAPPAAAESPLNGAVPDSYEYAMNWSSDARRLTGTGTIRFTNRGEQAVDAIWLRLRVNNGDRPERVFAFRGASFAEERADHSMVRLRLDRSIAPGARGRIGFALHVRVPRDESSFGRSAGADLFGDVLPVLAVAGPHGIRLGPEPLYGEGGFNPVADWHLRLKLPHGERAVLPGRQRLVRRTRWTTTWSASVRARDAAFATGRLRCQSRRSFGLRFAACGADVSRSKLALALGRAERAWKTMQDWYGHYDLPSMKVIVGELEFGGSEYPGLVFSTPDNATIAHEVAHQWFYGIVGNDQFRDPFLDESLTAYAEQQFHRSYRCDLASPIDGRAHGLGTSMNFWQHHPAAYEHTIYRGGACALTVLRRDIGEAAFRGALRAYVAGNAGKIAGVEDFLGAVRAAAPWYDLARWERLVGLR